MIKKCKKHGDVEHKKPASAKYPICTLCRREWVRNSRKKAKALLVAESGGRCCKCGYNKSNAALQFHHRDPTEKDFRISFGGRNVTMERLREEAAKCDLLCANCHAELHDGSIPST